MFPQYWGTDLAASAVATFLQVIPQLYPVLGVFAAGALVGVIINTIVRKG